MIKSEFPSLKVMRSIPVVGHESVPLAKAYDGIADMLLLDSHKPGDSKGGWRSLVKCWIVAEGPAVLGIDIPDVLNVGSKIDVRCHALEVNDGNPAAESP